MVPFIQIINGLSLKKGDDGNSLGITLQCNNQYLLESLSAGGT